MSGRLPRFAVLAIALTGLLALATYAFFSFRSPSSSGKPALSGSENTPVNVESVRVVPTEVVIEAAAVGSLRANQSVILRSETAGRIAALNFRDGTSVSKGTLLIELDAATQAAELDQARATLGLARANHQRNEDLFERKFISRQALDNTLAGLKVQEAAVALSQARFDKMRLRAPFAGIVGIRRVNVGDYVKEGQDLVNVEDIERLKVDFRLPETYLGQLQPGQDLEVSSDALPGQSFAAVVEAINPLVEAGGRAIALRAEMRNTRMQLRPGMFVRVRLRFERRANVLFVPEQAVVPDSKTPYVYRLAGGQAHQVPVKTGMRREGQVEISEGLVAGDEVVVAGQLKLRNGVAVRALAQGGGAIDQVPTEQSPLSRSPTDGASANGRTADRR